MAENDIGSGKLHQSLLSTSNLECKNLYDYLKTRPQNILEKLYNHPTICLAVYRCVYFRLYIPIIKYLTNGFLENYPN